MDEIFKALARGLKLALSPQQRAAGDYDGQSYAVKTNASPVVNKYIDRYTWTTDTAGKELRQGMPVRGM